MINQSIKNVHRFREFPTKPAANIPMYSYYFFIISKIIEWLLMLIMKFLDLIGS